MNAANNIIKRNDEIISTDTNVKKYSSKVYHSLNAFVNKVQADMIWVRSSGNLSN